MSESDIPRLLQHYAERGCLAAQYALAYQRFPLDDRATEEEDFVDLQSLAQQWPGALHYVVDLLANAWPAKLKHLDWEHRLNRLEEFARKDGKARYQLTRILQNDPSARAVGNVAQRALAVHERCAADSRWMRDAAWWLPCTENPKEDFPMLVRAANEGSLRGNTELYQHFKERPFEEWVSSGWELAQFAQERFAEANREFGIDLKLFVMALTYGQGGALDALIPYLQSNTSINGKKRLLARKTLVLLAQYGCFYPDFESLNYFSSNGKTPEKELEFIRRLRNIITMIVPKIPLSSLIALH